MHKVVITGFGVLAASGSDAETFWSNLAAGRSSLGPLTQVRSEQLSTAVAGEIASFDPDAHFGKEVELLDRFAQFALVCTRRAMAQAGLPERFGSAGAYAPERAGVLTGTGMGGICT
ncbi:MAG: beta-ketoacyl synthase N-terminal-like domain-containing protein, partial [Terriglobales bacterium]